MIKSVRTKSSAPGRASVKSSTIQKSDILNIFSGSDDDSTENSKAFDNPQEERGHNSADGAKTPDTPLPTIGNPSRSGANYNNPNFNLNTNKISEKPKSQLGTKSTTLSEKAARPLANTSTNDSKITNLSSVTMSKAVIEKYPAANDIARSNSSYPADFKSEMDPIKGKFNNDAFNQFIPTKNSVYQNVNEIAFSKVEEVNTNLKLKSSEEIGKFTNPEIQGDFFTAKAKDTISPNFLNTSELAPSNVFSEYSSSAGEYGKGQFPESTQASKMVSNNSTQAANISSPQRGADLLSNTEGKSSFKGGEPKQFDVNVDMSARDQVLSSDKNIKTDNTSSIAASSKAFFVSNFGSIPGNINDSINGSSNTTDSVSSNVSSAI